MRVPLLLIMYLSFVMQITQSKYAATVHQVSSAASFAGLAVTAMARTHTTEATLAAAQVNLRIGRSLAECLHNTTEEDVTASNFSWSGPQARVLFVNGLSRKNLKEMVGCALFVSPIEVLMLM